MGKTPAVALLPNEIFICVAAKFLANCNFGLFLTEYYKERLESQLKNKETHTHITAGMQAVGDVMIGQDGPSVHEVVPALIVGQMRFPHHSYFILTEKIMSQFIKWTVEWLSYIFHDSSISRDPHLLTSYEPRQPHPASQRNLKIESFILPHQLHSNISTKSIRDNGRPKTARLGRLRRAPIIDAGERISGEFLLCTTAGLSTIRKETVPKIPQALLEEREALVSRDTVIAEAVVNTQLAKRCVRNKDGKVRRETSWVYWQVLSSHARLSDWIVRTAPRFHIKGVESPHGHEI